MHLWETGLHPGLKLVHEDQCHLGRSPSLYLWLHGREWRGRNDHWKALLSSEQAEQALSIRHLCRVQDWMTGWSVCLHLGYTPSPYFLSQALKLANLLPQAPECWDYGCVPSCPVTPTFDSHCKRCLKCFCWKALTPSWAHKLTNSRRTAQHLSVIQFCICPCSKPSIFGHFAKRMDHLDSRKDITDNIFITRDWNFL
jgi:hypothetical protein